MDQRTTDALRDRLTDEQGELVRQLRDLGARRAHVAEAALVRQR